MVAQMEIVYPPNYPHNAQYLKSHFAPAFFLLSKNRRRALQVLYAVCRVLDDATDKEMVDPQGFLSAWKDVFTAEKTDQVAIYGQLRLAREFIEIRQHYDIPTFALVDLIEKGVGVDLKPAPFETPMDLERYCYGVAGTVGLACLPIFGVPWTEAKDFAIRLGVAIQWINIIRDVGVDATMKRVYIPLDHLEQFGYTETDLLTFRRRESFEALMEYEVETARNHYKRALELLPQKWRRELLPARIMGAVYTALLDKIEKKNFPVLHEKVALNWLEKAMATWRTYRG